MTFTVCIKRTVTTEISVEANSADEARQTVLDYGTDLAIADYPVTHEWVHRSTITDIRP